MLLQLAIVIGLMWGALLIWAKFDRLNRPYFRWLSKLDRTDREMVTFLWWIVFLMPIFVFLYYGFWVVLTYLVTLFQTMQNDPHAFDLGVLVGVCTTLAMVIYIAVVLLFSRKAHRK